MAISDGFSIIIPYELAYLPRHIDPSLKRWWRWAKDGRWSRWHLLGGCELPKPGTFTMCQVTKVPDEVDELDGGSKPTKTCRLCERQLLLNNLEAEGCL